MKKVNFRICILAVCVSFLMIFAIGPKTRVEAYISPYLEMPINYTPSVDNLQYPQTDQFTALTGTSGVGMVVIKEPTIIKAYMNWNSSEANSPVIWFSRDIKGIDLVGAQVTLSSSKNYQVILLDTGTYYFNYTIKANNSYNSSSYIFTTVGACLVGQYANSTERIYNSSKDSSNLITFNKMETGFLSITAPIDYYKFELNEKSIVTINFNFLELKDINLYGSACVLKNSMDANIVEQAYNSQGAQYNTITKVLEPGVYYITMKGTTTVTSLVVKKIPYVVKAAVSTSYFTKGNVRIHLKVPFEYTEILVTKGKVSKAKITDYYTWSTYQSETTKSLTDSAYTVTANGTYTFRILDYMGNYSLYAVKISNIDKMAPAVSGVKNGKIYQSAVTLKFSDGLSGIKSVLLNKKAIRNGAKVSGKGAYTLSVTDRAGNKKIIKFKIK